MNFVLFKIISTYLQNIIEKTKKNTTYETKIIITYNTLNV